MLIGQEEDPNVSLIALQTPGIFLEVIFQTRARKEHDIPLFGTLVLIDYVTDFVLIQDVPLETTDTHQIGEVENETIQHITLLTGSEISQQV